MERLVNNIDIKHLQERGIQPSDVKNAIKCGEIIEQYPTDHPCAECSQCGETWYNDTVAMRLEEILSSLKAAVLPEIAVVKYTSMVA